MGQYREYRLCCSKECDPFNCCKQDYHPCPLEKLKSYQDVIDPLTVSRFINEKVIAFINKCIKPTAKEYSLFLMFNRPSGPNGDSSIRLCGHIWIDELSTFNSSGEKMPEGVDFIPDVLNENSLKVFLGNHDGYAQIVEDYVNWPDHLYDNEKISAETLLHLQCSELISFRETSIFEFIFCSARNFTLAWASQSVCNVDTVDPRTDCIELKKLQGDKEEDEVYFFDYETKTWWMEYENLIFLYKNRPKELEAMVLLQLGLSTIPYQIPPIVIMDIYVTKWTYM